MAALVNDKVLPEIADIRDLSDRTGMRLEVHLKRERGSAGRPEQALQAHGAPDDLRLQRGRARRRRAADALAARARPPLPRLPARGRHPPLEVRAAQGRGARAHPRGLPDRARQPRRGHRAHPRLGRHRTRPAPASWSSSSSPRSRPRRSSTCGSRASPASSGSEIEDEYADLQERIARASRDPRRRGADRRADPRGAARDQGRSTAKATSGAPRSSPPRRSSSSRI